MPHRQAPFFSTEGLSCSITLKESFFALLTRFCLPLFLWYAHYVSQMEKKGKEEDREGDGRKEWRG